MTEDRLGQLRARAFENMVAVALANYPHHGGRSVAFDGVACWPDGSHRDHEVVRGGADDDIVMATLVLDLLREYRERETWGDAYRKPHAYRRLASGEPSRGVFAAPTPGAQVLGEVASVGAGEPVEPGIPLPAAWTSMLSSTGTVGSRPDAEGPLIAGRETTTVEVMRRPRLAGRVSR